MHTIEIPDKNISFQLPSEWEDCTPEQARFVLERAFDVMSGLLSISAFRVKVFMHFTGMKTGISYLIKQRLGLNNQVNERIYQLSHQLCDWIFVKKDDNYELNFESVQNFFTTIGEGLCGPDPLLADITLGEFKNALSALDVYFECKDSPEEALVHLDYFLGILYRPVLNGIKVPYHNYIVDLDRLKNVPIWQKQSIVIWFSYCVKCLQTEELVINGIECDLSVLFPQSGNSGGTKKKVNLGWTGIMMDIAESGVFGDSNSTSQTALYDILLYLLKKHQDQPKYQTK